MINKIKNIKLNNLNLSQFKQVEIKKEYLSSNLYLFNLGLFLLACFGLYLLVAWTSYHPADSTWTIASNQPTVINKAGVVGAWLIDILFALFGSIGNLIPFFVFLIPLYLLRYHPITEFKGGTFFLRSFGFLLFLVSLATLAALYLPDSPYHLAGGVIGAVITQLTLPLIGIWLLSLITIATTIIGFILSAGNSFIKVFPRFYHWLMATDENKPEEAPQNNEVEKSLADYEQIELPLPKHAVKQQQSQPTAETGNPAFAHLQQDQFVNPTIFGLTPAPTTTQVEPENSTDNTVADTPLIENSAYHQSVPPTPTTVNADNFNNIEFPVFDTNEITELPTVSLSTNLTPATTTEATQDLVNPQDNWQAQTAMPTVNLASQVNNPIQETQPSSVNHNEPEEDNEDFDRLRQEFLAMQQQKQTDMVNRAKALNQESALNHILTPSQDEDEPVEQLTPPNYKPYGNTLVHPLLQPDPISTVKPTTPLPSLDLLNEGKPMTTDITEAEIQETSRRIEHQLRNFGVKATVRNVTIGPVVTRYEIELQPGTKASKVTSIDTDLARALMFRSIRIAEVIPGKPYIGIETPNDRRHSVLLREVLSSKEFREAKSPLSMALGKDISGKTVVVDLAKMPHLLVAGSTGSGKSVGVNAMILSLLFKVKPDEVKFIMIDPKQVELSMYNDIPHLLTNVVTDMNKAANALRWCVDEMERRYQLLTALHVRNIEGFNSKIDQAAEMNLPIPNPIWRPGDTMDAMPPALEKLPYIVVIVDEFADLIMIVGKQVEELIARLAQKARAIGIHLILATQRPSVDVITGLIKANIPSRIAFTVASKIDSRTILDQSGAEALLGKGDMLYSGQGDLIRVHGAYMTDDEVVRVASDWRARGKPNYLAEIVENSEEDNDTSNNDNSNGDLDEKFDEAVDIVLSSGNTSASFLQRRLGLGFPRAARILDQMEQQGILSAPTNGKREILAPRNNY
ncbi:DNA translocase FtsK [Gallibacterium genomosp. 3]|uniref:DNA translocase FtsK n=1 Tax=Gallibacterium genomosp. 3 TaxID=505345 RepID=UPI000802868F|nr:DNA translocase FtsK [Gallibacterium genomosp. 3]